MSVVKRKKSFPTEESLHMATQAAAIGVWELTLPSNELQWSNHCNEIFGLPLDAELKYEDFLERVHPEDAARVDGMVRAVLDPAGSGDYELEYRIVRPNHEVRWVAAKGKAFFRQETGQRLPHRFLGTLLDRTEHKLMQEALVESEKLAVTGRLAASIAHEVRNPLESISNILFLLNGELSSDERAECVSLAQGELMRAADIVNNTLRLYRDPVALEQSYDLGEFVSSVLRVFEARVCLCRVKLQSALEAGIEIRISAGELRQVLVNLIGNALDALSPGGRLIVRLHRRAGSAGRQAMLTVADTGSGISPSEQARLFEAFHTTKGSKGNGIGLWLSREILNKHGATVRVRSKPGHGTVFAIFLRGLDTHQAEGQAA